MRDTEVNGEVTTDVEMKADTEVMAPAAPRTTAATNTCGQDLRFFVALMDEFIIADLSDENCYVPKKAAVADALLACFCLVLTYIRYYKVLEKSRAAAHASSVTGARLLLNASDVYNNVNEHQLIRFEVLLYGEGPLLRHF